MIPIDFTGKVAVVTGVGDNDSFAWYIGKALQAAGAKVVLACHPRMVSIVEKLLETTNDEDAAVWALVERHQRWGALRWENQTSWGAAGLRRRRIKRKP